MSLLNNLLALAVSNLTIAKINLELWWVNFRLKRLS